MTACFLETRVSTSCDVVRPVLLIYLYTDEGKTNYLHAKKTCVARTRANTVLSLVGFRISTWFLEVNNIIYERIVINFLTVFSLRLAFPKRNLSLIVNCLYYFCYKKRPKHFKTLKYTLIKKKKKLYIKTKRNWTRVSIEILEEKKISLTLTVSQET